MSGEPEYPCLMPHPEPVEAFVGYLCRRHYGWIDRTLAEIIELFAVLPEVLIPGPGGDGRSATRVGSPAPGRVEVMALTDPRGIHEWIDDPDAIPDVPGALGLWVRIMGEEREEWAEKGLARWDGTLVSSVRILRAERIWVAQQAWVDDYLGELEELHRHVARGAGTTLWPEPVGKCPNDGAPLFNTIGVDEITCRRCRFTWSGVALARLRLIFEQEGKRGKMKVEQEAKAE